MAKSAPRKRLSQEQIRAIAWTALGDVIEEFKESRPGEADRLVIGTILGTPPPVECYLYVANQHHLENEMVATIFVDPFTGQVLGGPGQ